MVTALQKLGLATKKLRNLLQIQKIRDDETEKTMKETKLQKKKRN